jgi:DNA-binding CsgD family transcriptional regulator
MRLLTKKDKEELYPFDLLSKRELEVAVAISVGWGPSQTSEALGISIKTYSTYRSRLLEKMHVKSSAELAVLAFEVKLIPGRLERWKEEEHLRNEHDPRNGGRSIPPTGGGSGLLPGTEAQAAGSGDGVEKVSGGDECGSGAAV